MKKLLILSSILAAMSFPALAQEAPAMDADENGSVTLEEFVAAYPTLEDAETIFNDADTDSDGLLSDEEIAAAYDAEIIPEME
ncbi:EF-hand domain-containing protein [uncultured Cohaesibacter sp.]|uniref:EF-hand domain-containing protein n=1 Tax=uncultured Cohaesibacter sp. TaxID=1002546 RepID=UPI0029C62218|nr:EF-hand domain-containing protein [uncultured Cohaesibacter sp.]